MREKLTPAFVRDAAPPTKRDRIVYWDTAMPWFGLMVTKSSARRRMTWAVRLDGSTGATIAVCRGSIACPVAVLKEWLAAAGITKGPVFRSVRRGGHVTDKRLSAQSVNAIVKKHAGKLGLVAGL